MKILLTNVPWQKEGYYGVRAGSRWPHFEMMPEDTSHCQYMPFPFYLAYAAAVLKKKGHIVHVIDAIAQQLSEVEFLARVMEIYPDVVVQEVSTPTILIDLHYAERIKSICKDAKIVFCGPHYHMQKEGFLEANKIVDFVIYGEYEYILRDLINELEHEETHLKIVDGLIYRDLGRIIKNQPAKVIENIDSLPWPARELLPMEKYVDLVGGLPMPSLQVWASRGCPFKCNFCLWPQLMYGGRSYRSRNPKDVAEEIAYCKKKWHFKSYYFDDDTFNIGKERMLELAKAIKKSKIRLPFAVMARADTMDEEQLIALRSAGLYSIKYGVESGSQDLVNNCGKALDLKKVEEIVNITKKLQIKVHLTFAFGLSGETKETIEQTIKFALKLDPDTVQFSIITPFPGSDYYKELDEKGYIESTKWEDYTGYTKAVIRTDNLSASELEDALQKAQRTWRVHIHMRDKEFDSESIKIIRPKIEKNRIFILYSSFKEHLYEIIATLPENVYLPEITIVATKNKESLLESDFSESDKIIVEGDEFDYENLFRALDIHDNHYVIIPVNNKNGAGYKNIISFFDEVAPEKHLAVTVDGNML